MNRFAPVFAAGTLLTWGWLGCEAVDAPAEPANAKKPMAAAQAAEAGSPKAPPKSKPPRVAELSSAETEGLSAGDLRQKGTDAYKAGEYDRAVAYYRAALEISDRDHELHRLLGSVYARQGAREAAYAEYKRYVEACPKCMYAPTVKKILADYEELKGLRKAQTLPSRGEDLGDPKTRFRLQVLRDDLDSARAILENELDPNGPGRAGGTWLHDLAFKGDPQAIALVLQAGGDPTAKDRQGQTPAHRAARWGRLEAVEVFLDHGLALDIEDASGRGLLHAAAAAHGKDAVALVERLLERGLKATARDEDGYTPLHLARTGDIARVLIEHGAKVDAKARLDRLRREMMARNNESFKKIEQKIGGHLQVDVGQYEQPRLTPLLMAARQAGADVIRVLLEHGADANATDYGGQTALASVSARGDRKLVELLMSHGAKPIEDGESSGNALHSAASAGKVGTIALLLEKGYEANDRDKDGRTPLHEAAEWGHVRAVETLLAAGAKLDATSNNGETPLHVSAGRHRRDSSGVVALLLERGADPNARDSHGNTPLWAGAQPGTVEVARLLLEAGADVNNRNEHRSTPLHWAVTWSRADYARVLLDAGAEVNARDEKGRTPLLLRGGRVSLEVARLLLERGADPDLADHDKGHTALHEAAVWGKADLAALLIDKGADVNVKDKAGRTPLALAIEKEKEAVAAMLREIGAEE